MQTHLSHLQFNVQGQNLSFYADLFDFLGWGKIMASDDMLGVGGMDLSLWFIGYTKDVVNDYDGPGLNHLAIGTSSIAEVDQAVVYLQEKGIAALFETPRHRPEFAMAPDQTYYQVMFESPDKILFEIVYIGPK